MIFVFDACALIAYLRAESGADEVEKLLFDADNECFVHVVNLCEVYYDFLKVSDEATAQSAIEDLKQVGLITRQDIDQEFWQQVGRYKANIKKVSLGDCFAIALVNRITGEVVTSDHHEFDAISAGGICKVKFIR